MINDGEYCILLKILSLVKEKREDNKKRKKKYSHLQTLTDDFENIISFYENIMDENIKLIN